MTPEKHYQDALDVLGTTFALANELDHIIESPITDKQTHDRVHALTADLSGHLLIVDEFEGYTGGDVLDAIENTRDRALASLSTAETKYELAA